MRSSSIGVIIGILAVFTLEQSSARRTRGLTRLPVPTSETIPYVAEVMGAASYEETVEEEEPSPVKRVQRKLNDPENTDRDLDPEQQEYAEYQGVMGRPGVDFPVLPSIPRTEFSCRKVKSSGYYADLETGCQVFHICDGGRKISFLCPNGTIFRQSHLICDWWFRVDCERSVELYEESAEQLAHDQMIYKKRAEEIAKAMASKLDDASTTERVSNFKPNRRKQNNFNDNQGQKYTPQASFNQEQTYKNPNTKNNYQNSQPEKERQVLAETASFASNRHRFANQINQNFYQNVQTTSPPTVPNQGNFNQYSTTAAPVQSTTLNRGNYNYNSFNNLNQYPTTPQPYQQTQNYYNQYQTTPKAEYQTQAPQIFYNQNQFKQQNQQTFFNQYQTTSPPQYQTQTQATYTQTQPTYTQTQPNVTVNSFSTLGYQQTTTQNYRPTYSTFNGYQSTSKPIPAVNQPIFNVKVKPNKEFSFVELQRQNNPTSPPEITTLPPYSLTPSTYSPTVPHSSTQFAYIPNRSTQAPVTTHQYATYNYSGTPEEIRPEVVNSLMETGVTPTSAKALHSLASYLGSAEVADAFSGESKKPHVSDVILNFHSGSTDTPATTILPNDENLPSVLTKQTKDSYEYLFSDSKEQIDNKSSDLIPKESGSILGNPTTQVPLTDAPIIVSEKSKSENKKLRDSSELRELAQVFSRALSAYLEDPDTFKEILAQVRPTEPNLNDNTTPSPDDEVLDFSDGSQSRIGTTEPPGTTAFADDALNIGEINNLSTNKHFEDNSLENASQQPSEIVTTVSPELNKTYYDKIGSSEDESYFPTAGSVGDSTRPRYGGFHNNSKINRKYSPYGADVPQNITGTPLSVSVTTSVPVTTYGTKITSTTTFGTKITNVPEPQSVNSLANNIYNTGFTSSGEESYESNGEEKLLIASGSQSLVSSNNYVNFAQDFNKQNGYTKDTSGTANDFKNEDYLPYFGQEPPLESLSEPSAFQTQNPVINVENQTVNIPYTTNKDSEYKVSYKNVNLGNGITLEKDTATSFSSFNTHSDLTTVPFSPTTYHPNSEPTASPFPETTTQQETVTFFTTMKPDHPEYTNYMESKAKEMFGMLNETAVGTLMNMMNQAENNMTIRRLVLLLVSDKGKENKTAAESRQSLINALLTDSAPEVTSTTPAPTTRASTPKRKVKVTRVRNNGRNGKSYRGIDSSTGNHGVQSLEVTNKLNSAKLYIPTTPSTTTTTESKLPYDSDARAVELLKTLYNLAAKWG